jgi:hypothetical protein
MTITNDDEDDIFEDDEGYLFAGQGICTKYQIHFYTTTPLSDLFLCSNVISIEESDDDVQSDTTEEDTASDPEVPDPYEKVYSNMPRETHMLKPVPNCRHCGAKRFPKEPLGFCCRNGKVELSAPALQTSS